MVSGWQATAEQILAELQDRVGDRDLADLLEFFEDPAVLIGTSGEGRTRAARREYLTAVVTQAATVRWDWEETVLFYESDDALGFAAFGEVASPMRARNGGHRSGQASSQSAKPGPGACVTFTGQPAIVDLSRLGSDGRRFRAGRRDRDGRETGRPSMPLHRRPSARATPGSLLCKSDCQRFARLRRGVRLSRSRDRPCRALSRRCGRARRRAAAASTRPEPSGRGTARAAGSAGGLRQVGR